MFSFGRPDVFSTGDLGLCTAVSRLYNVDRSDIKAIEEISKKWSPYRTTASWYLWRSLETKKE
jgi:3-methyladenine DNA glycosylase/8-oxoguanine DNA glycosylase